MMTFVTSINKAGAQTVPLPRATDAIGSSLRAAFGVPPLPVEMEELLRRLDHSTVHH